EVWSLPPLGTFNLHASLLPNFRGAAPINHAIIQGETETGVSSFLLDKEIDTGAILFQEKTAILPEDNAGSLHDRLMEMGAQVVVKTAQAIIDKTAKAIPQSNFINSKIWAAPKIFKQDCEINWTLPAQTILQHIKGLSPYPTAISELHTAIGSLGISCKIFEANLIAYSTEKSFPGQIFTDGKNYLYVSCGESQFIALNSIQLAGKKRLTISCFLRGFHFNLKETAYFQVDSTNIFKNQNH
ncbi:MAG: methionyl-tRNA formyltransferase, partial [Bacteroidales bacterium]